MQRFLSFSDAFLKVSYRDAKSNLIGDLTYSLKAGTFTIQNFPPSMSLVARIADYFWLLKQARTIIKFSEKDVPSSPLQPPTE